MRLVRSLAVLVLVLWSAAASGEPAATRIRAARLVDVEAGRIRDDVIVEIRGHRIAAVHPAAGVAPDAHDIHLDADSLTVLPGLIDAHVHLTLGAADSSAIRTLRAGFTTVQDLGALGYANLALRDSIAAGRMSGPRVVASGPWLGITGGICDFSGIGVHGVEAFRERVREDVQRGADIVKVCVTGWPQDGYLHPDSVEIARDVLDAVVAEAHGAGRKVAAHAIGAAGVRLAVDAGVDVIVHGGFADDVTLSEMNRRGVWLIPTLASFAGARNEPYGRALFERMRTILASGVPIAFGTDAGVIPHGRNAREFTWMVRLGMTPAAALRAATAGAARLLGRADRAGTIAPGHDADLIAVRGDPLVDPTALERVVFVMQGGRVVRDDIGAAAAKR